MHNNTISVEIERNLRQKFSEINKLKLSQLPKKCSTLAILSGPETGIVGENGKRVARAFEIQNYYKERMITVPVIYLGTSDQTRLFDKYARNSSEISNSTSLDIGKTANTLDQIKQVSLIAEQRKWKVVVLVTTCYHVPRVDAYCKKYLSEKLQYFIAYHGIITDYKDKVDKEIQRIINYSRNGDLTLN